MAQEDVFKKIVSHCKEYGFVFPSSDIYDGLAAVYDYGQNGVELKNNIKQYWWKSMVLLHDNIVGIDSAIFMHPTIWKASGHVDAFNDPLIDNSDSKKRYRADVLIEDQIAKYDEKIEKEIAKARKRFGESFDEAQFRATNARVIEHQQKRDALHARYTEAMQGPDLAELKQIILDEEIVDPISGTKNWTDVRQFNLMFSTEMGSVADGSNKVYLRPETAQGIFVNYLNVQKTGRMKIPFGIAQIGKAFRNEIVARQFIFRMREFEQMEMQFFVRPGEELKWFKQWKEWRLKCGPEWQGWKNEKERRTALVFTNAFGGHLHPQTVYNHFKKLAVSVGAPNARVHDLRHTYAVLSLQNGDDVKTVQGNLGHATAAFTLDVYGHVSERMKEDSANRMQRYIEGLR